MSKLSDITLKDVFYRLTDNREKPPLYIKVWIIFGFFSFGSLVIGDHAGNVYVVVFAIVLCILWGITTLVYLGWRITYTRGFVNFKETTQIKDDSFEAKMMASDRMLKPDGFNKRAG